MKTGLTIAELAAKLDSQAAAKKDFIAPTKKTHLDASQGDMVLTLEDQGSFPLQPLAHRQLATFTDVPARYYDRMRDEAPDLLAQNVNTWLAKSDKSRMVRTLHNNARAYLSNSFARIDNIDIAKVALPVLYDLPDTRIVSSEVTENKLYIHFVVPHLRGEIRVGDTVEFGGVISNSEVGLGSVSVSGLAWRLVCLNGMKTADTFRKTHVGRMIEDSEQLWADDTIAADDRAVLLKVRDMVKAVTDETRFRVNLEKLRGLTDGKTKNPIATVEVLTNKFGLSEGEKSGLLTSLVEGGDFSRWGITNAVTSLAHTAKDYDRSVEFETMGGALVDLSKDQWQEILAEAA
jgi:hypothetical protein